MEQYTCFNSRVLEPSPEKDYTSLKTPTDGMSPSVTSINFHSNKIPISRLSRKITGRKLSFSSSFAPLVLTPSIPEQSIINNKPLRGRPSAKDIIELHRLGADCKFKCSVCPMGFQRKKSLATHMLTHCAEKKHNCSYPECRKSFKQYSHLTTHWRTHTGEKPFICTTDNCVSRCTFKRGKCLLHPGSSFKRDDESTEIIMERLAFNLENMPEAEVAWIIEHTTKKRDNISNCQPSSDVLIGAKDLLFYINNYHSKV